MSRLRRAAELGNELREMIEGTPLAVPKIEHALKVIVYQAEQALLREERAAERRAQKAQA